MHAVRTERGVFHFALPRLLIKLAGGSSARGSRSALEAQLASFSFFAITSLFAFRSIQSQWPRCHPAALLVLPVFATWIFWLLAFYMNSLFIQLARSLGLFRGLPTVRAQSVFIGAETTALAIALLMSGGWLAIAGAIWLIGVALNLASAVVLALLDGNSAN